MKEPKVLNRKIISAETVLFREGDIANTAYLLKKGSVEIWIDKQGEHSKNMLQSYRFQSIQLTSTLLSLK